MNSSQLHTLLVFSILSLLFVLIICEPEFLYACDDGDGNYTTTSTYKHNLQTLLSSITSNTNVNYGFYNLSIGQDLDIVHGVGLCRGDIPTPDCKKCISYAANKTTSYCPDEKTAIGWCETCMIRYSNQDIFKGEFDAFEPGYSLGVNRSAPNRKSFNHSIATLLTNLAHKAAKGDSRRKFATGEVNVTRNLTIYALMQCVPDMEEFDCVECLSLLVNDTLTNYYGKLGARAMETSCNFRFDTYSFYQSPVALSPLPSLAPPPPLWPSPSPSSMTSTKGNKRNRKRFAIGGLGAFACLIVLVVFINCNLRKRRNKPSVKLAIDEEEDSEVVQSLQLDFNLVKTATDNFSDSNKLGKGGSGAVYKGVLPRTGQMIAVKRLSTYGAQGEKDFQTEALLVAKLQHRNLVKLIGYCLAKDERLLAYEFVPNQSLDQILFDPINRMHLGWEQRYKIIGGIARGLLYLHEESRLVVVHRDLKPSNVLLDADFVPKIADFGTARLVGAEKSHASTRTIAGTYGYMPPEYVVHGRFSIKSDVYSFGVLVLELISGQKVSKFYQAEDGETLLSFAWKNWIEGNALNLVDSTMSTYDTTQVLRCIHIGLLCVQENAAQRPIMSFIFLMLNTLSVTLQVPSRPAFQVKNDMGSSFHSTKINGRHFNGSTYEGSQSSLHPR